jgi:hypothetical protein
VKIEFLRAGEVGMTGPWRYELLVFPGKIRGILDGEGFFPIGPVAIFDAQRHWSANGLTVAHPREDVGAVFFDFLAAAAAVTELASMEFVVYEVNVNGKRRGQSRDEGKQSLSVRFTGGEETEHRQ